MSSILLLGSKSHSRKDLLTQAQIPFRVIDQDADESLCDWGLPLEQLVLSIALFKMEHIRMPAGSEGDICFVLTADTLSQNHNGIIQGKPIDRDDAIKKIMQAREGMQRLCTAFCIDKKQYRNGSWYVMQRITQSVQAEYIFNVPDHWIEIYLQQSLGLCASNAIAVEGFGIPFLKMVHGSYSAIVGLPLYEVRCALEELGFFENVVQKKLI